MNENKSRFLSVWRQSHIPTSSSSRRKSIILLRQHKEKGSMNSNMGQCIKDSTHRENRYDCVAVVVVFTFHKTASISSIDRAQTGGTEWAHAVNILSKCQRFWSHWRNATSFICVAFDTRMCAERWVLPLFSVFFLSHSMKCLALAFRHAHKCTWQVVTFFVYTKAHLKLLLC